mmetsp:Transcript_21891/g.70730  ORF Transcript_21891/g.70730 Transcript_21891/m.70730 type:complete len:95 (-) Transcript_21891:76-360(-)
MQREAARVAAQAAKSRLTRKVSAEAAAEPVVASSGLNAMRLRAYDAAHKAVTTGLFGATMLCGAWLGGTMVSGAMYYSSLEKSAAAAKPAEAER